MERHGHLEHEELAFSAPLTISEKDATKFKNELVKLIEKLGKTVGDSKSEKLMCLNIDWVNIL